MGGVVAAVFECSCGAGVIGLYSHLVQPSLHHQWTVLWGDDVVHLEHQRLGAVVVVSNDIRLGDDVSKVGTRRRGVQVLRWMQIVSKHSLRSIYDEGVGGNVP